MSKADLPSLSPIRPSLGSTRLSVRSTSRASPPNVPEIEDASALGVSVSNLPMSPSLAVVEELSGNSVDDDVFSTTSSGAASANLEGARMLLREQLKRTDPARVGKQKATSYAESSSRSIAPLPDNELAASTSEPSVDGVTRNRRRAKRRYYILSSAGKPVYCSDDDDVEAASTQVGIMQAIISIFADEGSNLRTLVADHLRISFLLKSPLYYVAVSDWAEPDSILRQHLEYLHLQIVSVTSASQLQKIFSQRKNFDLRRLLAGTEAQLNTLIGKLQTDLAIVMNSLHVFKLDPGIREKVADAMLPSKQEESAFYAILLVDGQIVTLLRPRRHSVHPSDLHLLINTVLSSPSLLKPGAESWIPICLPRFNSTGFLHALVSYMTERVGLVLLCNDREAFFNIREWKETARSRLEKDGLIENLERETANQGITLGSLGIPGLRHFVYKSRPFVQVVFPQWEGLYEDEAERARLVLAYHSVADQLHRKAPITACGRQAAKLVYLRGGQEAVLGWSSQAFELYLSLSPLLPKGAAVAAAHSVLRWTRQHESRLFLANAPVF